MEKRERWDSTNGRFAETGSSAWSAEIERNLPRASFARMRVHRFLNAADSRGSCGGFLCRSVSAYPLSVPIIPRSCHAAISHGYPNCRLPYRRSQRFGCSRNGGASGVANRSSRRRMRRPQLLVRSYIPCAPPKIARKSHLTKCPVSQGAGGGIPSLTNVLKTDCGR